MHSIVHLALNVREWTMFFEDPFGNPMEVEGFRSLATVCVR